MCRCNGRLTDEEIGVWVEKVRGERVAVDKCCPGRFDVPIFEINRLVGWVVQLDPFVAAIRPDGVIEELGDEDGRGGGVDGRARDREETSEDYDETSERCSAQRYGNGPCCICHTPILGCPNDRKGKNS